MTKLQSHRSSPWQSHGSSFAQAVGDSRIQLSFDFRQTSKPDSHNASIAESPARQFALRFAGLLESDTEARFDNVAISGIAREVFGSSAGHGRDAYDAAEAAG